MMAVQNISLKVLNILCSCWENLLHVAIGNLETLMTWSASTAVCVHNQDDKSIDIPCPARL